MRHEYYFGNFMQFYLKESVLVVVKMLKYNDGKYSVQYLQPIGTEHQQRLRLITSDRISYDSIDLSNAKVVWEYHDQHNLKPTITYLVKEAERLEDRVYIEIFRPDYYISNVKYKLLLVEIFVRSMVLQPAGIDNICTMIVAVIVVMLMPFSIWG